MRMDETVDYTDAHSHFASEDGHPCVVSLEVDELERLTQDHGYFSVGVHPWKIHAHKERNATLGLLRDLAAHPRVVAIGECGLDRLRRGFPAEQEAWFVPQMKLAEELGKPLIIHCVRAYGELMRLQKRLQPTVPLLVHGYNANAQIAAELLRKGFYLSLGPALLNPLSNAARLVSAIPLERLLLETDDTGLPIASIYAAAADFLNLPLDELKALMYSNFTRLFCPSGLLAKAGGS